MTRSDLIDALAARFPALGRSDADAAVKIILDHICSTLMGGGRIEVRGFGSFELKFRMPRIGRNPKSGDQVEVPGKCVPHLKAGKEMRDRGDIQKL